MLESFWKITRHLSTYWISLSFILFLWCKGIPALKSHSFYFLTANWKHLLYSIWLVPFVLFGYLRIFHSINEIVFYPKKNCVRPVNQIQLQRMTRNIYLSWFVIESLLNIWKESNSNRITIHLTKYSTWLITDYGPLFLWAQGKNIKIN